jgi:hypothetical protein
MNYQRLGGRIFRGLILGSFSFSSLLFFNPAAALAASGSNLSAGSTISPPANATSALTPLTSPPGGGNSQDVCGPVAVGYARCLSLRRTDLAPLAAGAVSPALAVAGYGPADLRSAYNLPSNGGAGLTVAIVDAYDQPRAESDLAAYRSHYGLPACTTANGCFRKVDQTGGTNYPVYDQGWGGEIDLDLDMVSAACPNCRILLVEANNNAMSNLGPAVNLAVALGAIAVSNSYAGGESGSASYYDATYYNHPGVAIVAGSGDCGYNCEGSLPGNAYIAVGYPAASPYVVGVGGTKLVHAANARGWSETAWGDVNELAGAGAGCSLYEVKPAWQHDPNCAKRMVADVSAVADPNPGLAEYDADEGGWVVVGGTSAATPIIAATFALAGKISAGDYPASYLYADAKDLNDVVGGNSLITTQTCPYAYFCQGVPGYDGPTGLGTPNGVGAFHSPFSVPSAPTNVSATPSNFSAGVSWTAPANNGGSVVTTYTATSAPGGKTCVTSGNNCTVLGLTNGQAYTFTVTANNAVGTGPASAPSASVTPIPPTGSTYHPITPIRLLDTRHNNGLGGRLLANTPVTFGVTQQVRADSTVPAGASAVTGNITVTGSSFSWAVYLGPNPVANPGSSTINFTAGQTTGNGLTVALSSTGTLSATYLSTAGNTTDLVFDVTGYFTPDATGSTYHPLTPARLLDTRYSNGLSQKLNANTPTTFYVSAQNRPGSPIPAGATAVTGNVTVVNETFAWAVFLGPEPIASPTTSTVNFVTGDIKGNNLTVALGTGGSLSATYISTPGNTTDLVFDVTGYYTNDASGSRFVPLNPTRLLDTRFGNGLTQQLTANTPATFWISTQNRPTSPVPVDATAVTGNVTVVNETFSWAIFLGPNPTVSPGTSTINFVRGDIKGNGLAVGLGTGGSLSATYISTPGNKTDLVFDVTGYFVPGG